VAGYTIRNLKQVEDKAAKYGFAPALESRFAREELECEQHGLTYQRLAPGATHPFAHRHQSHEEVYVVVGGSGQVRLDDEIRDVAMFDAIRVAPETVRAFAAGAQGLEILVFGPRGGRDAEAQRPAWPEGA
jgi:mannose-6-phosphate isomerase-like protein (cupin superfamily)